MASIPSAPTAASAPLDATALRHRRNRLILCGVTALVSAAGIATSLGAATAGELPAVCRIVMGAVGLTAGALLWFRPTLGWWLGCAWALAQIPVFAWSPAGSPTAQWPSILLGFTSKTVVNGTITAYSAIGVNAVGLVLFSLYQRWRSSAYNARPRCGPHQPDV